MALNKVHKLEMGVTFVLGGARSGKSEFAERLTFDSGLKPVYLATARGNDEEMQERISRHRQRREKFPGPDWETVEEPLALADALRNCCFDGRAVLVDCLTLWLNNLMAVEADVERESTNLVQAIASLPSPIVFVSNEVGQGIVPANAMARQFRDLAGMMHQKIATRADHVYFVTAGLPLALKAEG